MSSEKSFTPTDQDITSYENLKQDLLRDLRKGKFFREQKYPGFVGLINQGATCYLNALVQVLYNTVSFRNIIISGESNGKIVSALRNIFSQLLLSDDCAISTKELTLAFGWSNSEVFEQHDVQELFASITDALSQESPELEAYFASNFKGKMNDQLECPSCNFNRDGIVDFQDIPITLPEDCITDENKSYTLKELFQKFSATETLDANNPWTCTNCNAKVQAKKTTIVQKLPNTLFLHIKRLAYDQVHQRRKKISNAVYFPATITEGEIHGTSSGSQIYHLRGVLVHTGTANGGHYKAYVQSANSLWYEYDDANVFEYTSSADVNKLFWYNENNSNGKQLNQSEADSLMKSLSIYESVYMLVYMLESSVIAEKNIVVNVPASIKQDIAIANQKLVELKKANEVHKLMTEIICYKINADVGTHVKSSSVSYPPVSTHVIGTTTLGKTTQLIYDLFVNNTNNSLSNIAAVDRCRLRRYNSVSRMLGETFSNKENMSLLSVGLSSSCCLALEVLTDTQTSFVDFNEKEIELRLIEHKLDANNEVIVHENLESLESTYIAVSGEDKATVGDLRSNVSQRLNITEQNRVLLIKTDNRSLCEDLSDNAALLVKVNIHSGDDVIAIALPAGESYSNTILVTNIVNNLKLKKRSIKIFYNLLGAKVNPEANSQDASDANLNIYDKFVIISMDDTLGNLKEAIGKAQNASLDTFHLRRNAGAPQLKQLTKSLESVGFVDQSIIHIQEGKEQNVGEHLIRCEVDLTGDVSDSQVAPEIIPVEDFVVRGSMSVSQLREYIFQNWNAITGNKKSLLPNPKSPNHIRIKDGKSGMPTNPLRDDRILSRCLLGLADGRKISIQILEESEVIGADHLYIFATVIAFQSKVIFRPVGLSISRHTTIRQLYQLFIEKFPRLNEPAPVFDPSQPEAQGDTAVTFPECTVITCAKGLSTGPVLTIKSALQLKWNDASVLSEHATAIDQPPLNLRDGSLIVIRSAAEFERAREDARARVAARPSSSAGDSPARGKIRPGSRGVVRSRAGAREKGIKINVEGDESGVPSLPKASPEKLVGSEIFQNENLIDNNGQLPNAPVRVVKVLRSPRPDETN